MERLPRIGASQDDAAQSDVAQKAPPRRKRDVGLIRCCSLSKKIQRPTFLSGCDPIGIQWILTITSVKPRFQQHCDPNFLTVPSLLQSQFICELCSWRGRGPTLDVGRSQPQTAHLGRSSASSYVWLQLELPPPNPSYQKPYLTQSLTKWGSVWPPSHVSQPSWGKGQRLCFRLALLPAPIRPAIYNSVWKRSSRRRRTTEELLGPGWISSHRRLCRRWSKASQWPTACLHFKVITAEIATL